MGWFNHHLGTYVMDPADLSDPSIPRGARRVSSGKRRRNGSPEPTSYVAKGREEEARTGQRWISLKMRLLSLKLTFSHLEMVLSFWVSAYFQVRTVSSREGRYIYFWLVLVTYYFNMIYNGSALRTNIF